MSQNSYSEKLKDPRWQKKRLKVMEYANWRCQICGCKDKTLHIHHSYYIRGKQPWQYPEGSLICICHACHDKIHGKKEEKAVEKLTPEARFRKAFMENANGCISYLEIGTIFIRDYEIEFSLPQDYSIAPVSHNRLLKVVELATNAVDKFLTPVLTTAITGPRTAPTVKDRFGSIFASLNLVPEE
jgi:hypothetical protein